jgi:hypothetical protein
MYIKCYRGQKKREIETFQNEFAYETFLEEVASQLVLEEWSDFYHDCNICNHVIWDVLLSQMTWDNTRVFC